MCKLTLSWYAMMLLVTALACRGASAQEEFEGWNLEPGVGQAHLVMVARVDSIGRVTVVEGAKTDVALREFRFQPVRVLKGIFQRDQLSMLASDLGIDVGDASSDSPLKEGEFRLLILAQLQGSPFGSQLQSFGCVSAAPGARTFNERVPLLTGPEDPLVGVVETLINVADSRSRRQRATLVVDRLTDVNGLSAVPLLSSLRLRADWAATDPRALAAAARLAHQPATAVRSAAVEVLRDMLASGVTPNDPQQLDDAAEALRAILESDEALTRVRLAALQAVAHLLALNTELDWPQELLISEMTSAATYAERAATASALARIAHPRTIDAVMEVLEALPLDAPPVQESAYSRAAVRLDAPAAERALLTRLERSLAARQSLATEVELLGEMQSEPSLPLLLIAAGQLDVSAADRLHIARALGRLGDDRAVPVLANWLQGNDYKLKEQALAALEILDSSLAVREVRPLLKSEAHLPYKLRMARLLARHEMADGYSLATEHLADKAQMAGAALVLIALDDPRTANDLSAVVAARPDRRWHAAALAGLAATGDEEAKIRLLEVLADDRNGLAADAVEAAGLVAEDDLLLPLAKLAKSRNSRIASGSLVAMRRFLTDVRTSLRGLAAANDAAIGLNDNGGSNEYLADEIPAEIRAAVFEAVRSLAVDPYVAPALRGEALAVARLLRSDLYAELLSDLADQAELEGTPLLKKVQAERRRAPGLIEQP